MEQTSDLPTGQTPPQITLRRILRLALLSLVAAGLFIWWYRQRPPAPPDLPDIPLDAMEPQVVAAIEKGIERVRKEPNSANSWGFLGEILLAHTCEKQAEPYFVRAIQLDEREPRWPYYLFQCLVARDRDLAIPYLERAVVLFEASEPDLTAPRLTLVEVLIDSERIEEAEEQLRRVEEQEPNNPRVLFYRGILAFRNNDLARALECFKPLANLPESKKKACAQLAVLYLGLNQPGKAAEYGDLARGLADDDAWHDPLLDECMKLSMDSQRRLREARKYERQGRFREAGAILEDTARDSKHISVQINVGTNLAQQERFEEAIDLLHKLLKKEPQMVPLHYNLGVALYYWGESIREKTPGEREQMLAKYREAIPSLRQVIVLKPDHALAHTFLGLTLWRLGDHKEGMKTLREATRLQPVDMLAHFKLGQILEEDNRYEEALEELRQSRRFAEKEDPRPTDAIESLMKKMKNPQK